MKNNKAITLIALIITIIVLIILAGVTINMVLGENGIINKSKTSVAKYENAQAKENTALEGYETEIDNASRETITISKEEYDQMKTDIDTSKTEIQALKNIDKMMKPNLWEANTKEYDFGDGIYGRRFTGTIRVSTKSTRADIILTDGPVKTIINAGGCVNYVNGDVDRGLYIGYGVQTYQTNNAYFCGLYSGNGNGKVYLSLATSSGITYPADLPYDIWITYTK